MCQKITTFERTYFIDDPYLTTFAWKAKRFAIVFFLPLSSFFTSFPGLQNNNEYPWNKISNRNEVNTEHEAFQ